MFASLEAIDAAVFNPEAQSDWHSTTLEGQPRK